MKKSAKGFTLIELLIALGVLGILMAIAYPTGQEWLREARYREAARNITSALRDARARAVGQNLEHRIVINTAGNRYQMTQGNRPANSSQWITVLPWIDLTQNNIRLSGTQGCNNNVDFNFSFNPNGSGNLSSVCIMDENSVWKYRVRVTSATSGRIIIQRWNAAANAWQ